MARKNLREFLKQMLQRQQDAAEQVVPEPSYFGLDAKKLDGKADEKRHDLASRRQQVPRGVESSRGQPRPGPSRTGDVKQQFDQATDAKRMKQEIEILERFKTPQARASAVDAVARIQQDREDIEKAYRADIKDAQEAIRRLTDHRWPAPPDAARDANMKFVTLADNRERAMARLDVLQAAIFAELDVSDVKLKNWGPNRLRLETSYQTDLKRDFNAAGTPEAIDVERAEMPDDDVIHVQPEPESDPGADDPVPAPPVDWVAEFNKHARPPQDGPGIRP